MFYSTIHLIESQDFWRKNLVKITYKLNKFFLVEKVRVYRFFREMVLNDNGSGSVKEKAITCLRPSSGGLHLGHWIGNIQPLIKYQYEYDCSFIFADLQLINSSSEKNIQANIFEMMRQMIALGVDPNVVSFYLESQIKQNCLSDFILLSDFLTQSRINRLPVLKVHSDSIKMSMLLFPLLQMLDFYTTGASVAFSNTDNKAAIELANEVFTRMNNKIGTDLPHIRLIHGTVEMLVGVDGQKMSKAKGNCISFEDNATELKKKINKMYTDPNHIHPNMPGNIEKNVVFMYYKAFLSTEKYEDLVMNYQNGNLSDSDSKRILFSILNTLISTCQEKADLISDKTIEQLLDI